MSWDSGNDGFSSGNAQMDFSSGNAQMDFSSGNAQMDFSSGNAGFSSGGNADFSSGGNADFSSGGNADFSSGGNADFSSGGNANFSSEQGEHSSEPRRERPDRPEPSEETLKFRNYQWASNRSRYEYNENAADEYGMAPRDEELEKELFGDAVEAQSGLDFDKYNDIPVAVERGQAPPRIQSFEQADLHPVMKENVKLAHYIKPTPVQTTSIPIVTSGKDLMACAQTGSGKTAAFLIPTLSALFYNAKEIQKPRPAPYELRNYKCEPLILIIAPTRELCSQIFDDCRRFTYRSSLRPCAVYGGADTVGQIRQLERGCDVLTASPGRLIDFIQRGKIGLNRIQFLILDEADRMLDMGFEAIIRNIIQKNGMNQERQTLLFSATFPRAIRALARDFLKPDYLFLKVGRVGGIPNSITQKVIEVEEDEKRKKLEDLLRSQPPTRTLIFVETKRSADSLDQYLFEREFPSTSIHGDRTQMEREDALLAFKRGNCPILVATAVAARGIDIRNVMHVINYDMPKDMDEYIHRIGRTARQGKTGLATSFYNSGSDAIATELTKLLKECKQEIPDFLRHYETDDIVFDEDLDDAGVEQPSYAGQEYVPPERENADWMCTTCNVTNFASRPVCFKCQGPKGSAGESGESGGYGENAGGYGNDSGGYGGDSGGYGGDSGGYGGDSGGYGGGSRSKPGDWNCPDCNVSNFGSRQVCFKCSASKPEGLDSGSGGGYGGGGGSRSKPGDWNCPDCNVSNFGSRQVCFKCSASKPEGLDSGSGDYGGGYGGGGGSRSKPGDWNCPDCNVSNFGSRQVCFKCSASKPEGLDSGSGDYGGGYGGGGGSRSKPGDWNCPDCNVSNFGSRQVCFKCSTPKPEGLDSGSGGYSGGGGGYSGGGGSRSSRPGDWNCPSCSAMNYSNRTECFKCHSPKEGGGGGDTGYGDTGYGDYQESTPADGGAGNWDPNAASTGWSNSNTVDNHQASGGWNSSSTPAATQAAASGNDWNAPSAPQTSGDDWNAPSAPQTSSGGGWNSTPTHHQTSSGGATQASSTWNSSYASTQQTPGQNQPSSEKKQWSEPVRTPTPEIPLSSQWAPKIAEAAPQTLPPTGGGWGEPVPNTTTSGW